MLASMRVLLAKKRESTVSCEALDKVRVTSVGQEGTGQCKGSIYREHCGGSSTGGLQASLPAADYLAGGGEVCCWH